MTPMSEEEVHTTAKLQGYRLTKCPGGYQLARDHSREQEIIITDRLELLAAFLLHYLLASVSGVRLRDAHVWDRPCIAGRRSRLALD
jgi:hypothetical protein